MQNIDCTFRRIIFTILLLQLISLSNNEAAAQVENRRKRNQSRNKPPTVTEVPAGTFNLTKVSGSTLQGKVIDALTGEAIIGAAVTITELNKGTFTDQDGTYNFPGLKPGDYTLIVSFMGYNTQKIQEIKIENDAGAKVNVSLSEAETVTMQAVVVEAKMRESSDAALLNIQRNSLQVSDGYSGDMILRQTPDLQSDIALRRMPGVAMLEDKFLSVRGLYERYVNFTFDNALLPVSDLERAGFNMNVIPANLISSMRLIKTATAD